MRRVRPPSQFTPEAWIRACGLEPHLLPTWPVPHGRALLAMQEVEGEDYLWCIDAANEIDLLAEARQKTIYMLAPAELLDAS